MEDQSSSTRFLSIDPKTKEIALQRASSASAYLSLSFAQPIKQLGNLRRNTAKLFALSKAMNKVVSFNAEQTQQAGAYSYDFNISSLKLF